MGERMLREFISAHFLLAYELAGVFAVFMAVILVFGVLFARFDRVPLEDAIYFAFITAFTVGFGDVTPKSRGARVLTIMLAFLGLILMGVAVAVAVHALDIVLEGRTSS
jgi:voltage-gated potassium channel